MEQNRTIKAEKRRVIIIGATSGIGRELALKYLALGCRVAATGRRVQALDELHALYPEDCYGAVMDVQKTECIDVFHDCIAHLGGLDLFIYCAGVGDHNPDLDRETEMNAVYTNVEGYARLVVECYNYLKTQPKGGRIAVLSSVAATRGMRMAPAYSATKRFEAQYTACLAQKAHKDKAPIKFTTIMPGFITTPLLKRKYPLQINLDKGARLIFEAIEKGRRKSVLPGRWRVVRFFWRLIPEWLWERM